jgi:hypothetical protein
MPKQTIWKKHFPKGGVLAVGSRSILLKDSLSDRHPVTLWYGRPITVWIVTETDCKLTAVCNGMVYEIKTLELRSLLGELEFYVTQRR